MGVTGGSSEFVHIRFSNTYYDFASISHKINPYSSTSFGAIKSQKFAKCCEKSILRSNYMVMKKFFVTLHLFGKLSFERILSQICWPTMREVRKECLEYYIFHRDVMDKFFWKHECIRYYAVHWSQKSTTFSVRFLGKLRFLLNPIV